MINFVVMTESNGKYNQFRQKGGALLLVVLWYLNETKTWGELCGFSVITFDDAAKFLFASHAALSCWFEIYIQYIISDVFSAMRSFCVVIMKPCFAYVVKLSMAETCEVIQAFAFECTYEALAECIGFGRLDRGLMTFTPSDFQNAFMCSG